MSNRSFLTVLLSVLFLVVFFPALPVVAQAESTGLPLPRFVSLRANEVNLRTGPGTRYPIEWTYTRKDLPVEIVAEFENWRKIRDWQGIEGWVHQTMVSSRRMMVVTGQTRTLYSAPEENAPPVAKAETGVFGRLWQCPRSKEFCKVELEITKEDNQKDGTMQGWMRRDELWGVHKGEVVE